MMTPKMQQIFDLLEEDLESISRKFDNPKVTLVIRDINLDGGVVILSCDDDKDQVIAELVKAKAASDKGLQ